MCKSRSNSVFIPLLLVFVLSGCINDKDTKRKFTLQGSTMGTRYHITVVATNNDFKSETIKELIENHLLTINQQMSTYISDSEISLFNNHEKVDWFPISSQFLSVVKASQKISKITNGSFDITAGNLVNLWGFGPKNQLEIPTNHEISTTLQKTSYQLLDIRGNPPSIKKKHAKLKIDLSAVAKGYAVDEIGRLLRKQTFNNYLVEIGGEVTSHGLNLQDKPWRIAIENPSLSVNKRGYQHTIELNNQSVATSGDYRNYFEKSGQRYSHTIDPSTGKPVTHNLASVTVIGKSAMNVDALATALMVMGDVKGKTFIKERDLDAFMIIRNPDNSFTSWNSFDPENKQQAIEKK